MSCSLTGSVGTCSPIAPGAPPLVAAQCPAAAASTCGNDGTCDGAGACRKHVSGTQCAAPMCSSATIALSARTCNGAGVCGAATSSPCGKYTCDTTAGACRTSCTTAATDCVAPNICNANICTLKPTGAACTTAGECDSNFCAQGFCCNQACDTAVQVVRDRRQPRDVQQRRQRHRAHARDPVRGDGGDVVWARRHVQRGGRVPLLGERDAVRGGDLRRLDADAGTAPATAPASAGR